MTMAPAWTCPMCGGTEWVDDVKLDGGRDLVSAWVEKKPNAMIMKGIVDSHVHGAMCAGCGFIAVFADNPETLREADRERRRNR